MSAYLLRECSMRYEVQFSLGHIREEYHGFKRSTSASRDYGADRNGLFIEREDAERCAAAFTIAIINEVEVPPDYNGEQDHA